MSKPLSVAVTLFTMQTEFKLTCVGLSTELMSTVCAAAPEIIKKMENKHTIKADFKNFTTFSPS